MSPIAAALAFVAMPGLAAAAQPDPAALEPAVQTSPATTPAAPPANAAPRPPAAPPASPAPEPAAPAPRAASPATPSPSPPPGAPREGASAPAANTPARGAGARGDARDRIELEATQITGNRELPRVMYVVPWKKADPGDLGGRPARSLLDEVLAPVDRDVFRRENRYYEALQPDR